jgi:FkbM family methyltransferase
MPNLTRKAAQTAAQVLAALVGQLSAGDRSSLARELMQDRYHKRTRALAAFFEQGMHAWQNRQYAVHLNGETALLTRLAAFAPKLVIDVGANVGDWSLAAAAALPGAVVHAFEIAAPTAALLRRNTGSQPDRIVINTIGLGETEGEITLYFMPDANTATSTVKEAALFSAVDRGDTEMQETRARITTGDTYLRDNGIGHVDMLKIDVEGAEFAVLRGFADSFAAGGIDVVQFEYGKLNLGTREFLGDFWRFFTDRGFAVGKLYPEGVAFKDYDLNDEDFIGPNYIACRQERADIIAALRCAPLTTA